MQMKPYHIFWLLVFGYVQAKGQTLLHDSLRARFERQEYSLIIFPAYYTEISNQLGLSKISDSDSFSIRLWTSGMFGYGLHTFVKEKNKWQTHSYEYRLDSSLEEIKIKPKISLTGFVTALQAINFTTLISQNEIKDFIDNVDDGVIYTLEITIGKSYKVFQYHSPDSFSDKDNKTFSEIISLITKYFSSEP